MLASTGRFDVSVNPFVPNARFPYLLKTKIFTVLVGFQGVENRCIGNEWVNQSFDSDCTRS